MVSDLFYPDNVIPKLMEVLNHKRDKFDLTFVQKPTLGRFFYALKDGKSKRFVPAIERGGGGSL